MANGKMDEEEAVLVALEETATYMESLFAKGRPAGKALRSFRKRMNARWENVRDARIPKREFSYTDIRDTLREILDARGIADVRFYNSDEEE